MKNKRIETDITINRELIPEIADKIEWIVVLRAIACIAVIMLHVTVGWRSGEIEYVNLPSERQFFYDIITPLFTRFAPLAFIMISGCLLLNPKHEVNILKIKKYILKMLCILMIFGLTFSFIENIFDLGISNIGNLIYRSFSNLLQEKTWAHMWYIYMLSGLYMITPILRKFIKHADVSTVRFTLEMLFIVSVMIPTINAIFNLSITVFYLFDAVYIFTYLIGYYVVYTDIIQEKTIFIAGIIGIIGHLMLCLVDKSCHNNVFIIFETIFIVKLFSMGKIKLKRNKLIQVISKYSLGIYLVHTFYINLLYKVLKIYPFMLPIGVGEILVFFYVLFLSIATSVILYRLPVLKKIW